MALHGHSRVVALASTFLLAAATLSPSAIYAEKLLGTGSADLPELLFIASFPAALLLLVAAVRRPLERRTLIAASTVFLGYGALAVLAHESMGSAEMSPTAVEFTGHVTAAGALALAVSAAGDAVADRIPRWFPLAFPVVLVVAAAFVPVDPLQRAIVRGPLPLYVLAGLGALQLFRAGEQWVEWVILGVEWSGAMLVLFVTTLGVATCTGGGRGPDVPPDYFVSYSLAENTLTYGTQSYSCTLSPNMDAFLVGATLLFAMPLARWGVARFGPALRARLAQS